MDLDFQTYHWDSTSHMSDESQLIDDLFFGFESKPSSDWKDEVPDKCNMAGRTRKVTITEITEEKADEKELEEDIFSSDEESSEAEEAVMETEEVFQLLDDVVQDWKIKLECVVGDGLKKLRKAGKEKKLMIKYLPGEHAEANKKLGAAKATILKDWKTDFNHVVGGIQRKLDKLAKDKFGEVDALYNDKFLYTNKNVKEKEYLNKNKKNIISIDCREQRCQETGGSSYFDST